MVMKWIIEIIIVKTIIVLCFLNQVLRERSNIIILMIMIPMIMIIQRITQMMHGEMISMTGMMRMIIGKIGRDYIKNWIRDNMKK